MIGQVLDGTPRYVRVTFLAATSSGRRRRSRWIGQVRRQGDLLRGERKDAPPASKAASSSTSSSPTSTKS